MIQHCDRITRIDDFKWYELPIKWMMLLFGWKGYTAPCCSIYYIGIPSKRLKKHENKHAWRMEKEGWEKYHLVYAYHFIKGLVLLKGFKQSYLDIPYEVEAREAEKETNTHTIKNQNNKHIIDEHTRDEIIHALDHDLEYTYSDNRKINIVSDKKSDDERVTLVYIEGV